MEYFIGLDIGTSAVKGALLSEDGRLITVTDKKFEYEDEGTFRLLDPEDFCKRCFDVIRDLSDKADGRIAAVCFCHASGNPLFLDADMKPLTHKVSADVTVVELALPRAVLQLDAGRAGNFALDMASQKLLEKLPAGLVESFSGGRIVLNLDAVPQLKALFARLQVNSLTFYGSSLSLDASLK